MSILTTLSLVGSGPAGAPFFVVDTTKDSVPILLDHTGITAVIDYTNVIPEAPAPGDSYLIAAGAPAPWATYIGDVATWDDIEHGWIYAGQPAGTLLYITATSITLRFNGTAWVIAGGQFENTKEQYEFLAGDQLYLLSCGVMLPSGFSFYLDYTGHTFFAPNLVLKIYDGTNYFIPQEIEGGVPVSSENTDISINILINPAIKLSIPSKFQVSGYLGRGIAIPATDPPQISMKGVPSTLKGFKFAVDVYLRVLSNFAMVVEP
ncbi:MAG: DUF2793 domain-containing protein [Chitinivibrionales bacterium]